MRASSALEPRHLALVFALSALTLGCQPGEDIALSAERADGPPSATRAPVFSGEPEATPDPAPLGEEAQAPRVEEPEEDDPTAPIEPEPEAHPEEEDGDQDGVADAADNCPEASNAAQCDADGDGVGDACAPQDGSWAWPLIIPTCPTLNHFVHIGDTCEALSDEVDSYPPAEQLEAGGEVVYLLTLEGLTEVHARLEAPEPDGVDVDLHLLASANPLVLIDRGHHEASAILEAGTYLIVADTYGADDTRCGPYRLDVSLTPRAKGTLEDPVIFGQADDALTLPFYDEDMRDTSEALSQVFDSYPPDTSDQSGNEVIYRFTVAEEVRLAAVLRTPEPEGVDIDLHLLSDLEEPTLIERGDRSVYAILEPGTYFLVADTFVDTNGTAQSGAYHLSLSVRRRGESHPVHFNPYILAAVDYLYAHYGLLGYDAAALTHDMAYGDHGTIFRSGGAKTMCVAGMLEVIVQAMTLYGEDTGDWSLFDNLPLSSWTSLHSHNIKAHIWVNHELDSWGTPDALVNFQMGEVIPFEELEPGAFLNLNRVNGTGHAVVFMAFIDMAGNTYATHNKSVIGFKYFSAQGDFEVGAGGLDFRYAVFDDFGKPEMPYKRDSGVIQTDNQRYLNTGAMFMPAYWGAPEAATMKRPTIMSAFDAEFFSGDTGEDDETTRRGARGGAPDERRALGARGPRVAGALRAPVILMAMLMTMTCGGEDWGWSEAVVQGGDSALGLSVTWSEAPEVRGWLYTYGLSWQRCPEPSLAERLGLEGVAKASHPVAFDGEGQWRWHATIEVGEAGSERLEMRLEPGTYCGLRWLFSHGGRPRDGVLASMQLDAEGETFALSSHAATVALAFDAPVCVGEEVPEFTLTLDMGAWIAGFRERTNPALAARDGWLSMADYLSTSASPCP